MSLLVIYLIGLVICMIAFLLLCYFKPDVIPKFGLDIAGSWDILGTLFVIIMLLFLLTIILPLYLISKGINSLMDKGKKRQARIKREKTIGERISKYY